MDLFSGLLAVKALTIQKMEFKNSRMKAPTRLYNNCILLYDFFNGDTGEGLGASHQTGWRGLIAKLICALTRYDFPGFAKI
jgi:hypothetical protein